MKLFTNRYGEIRSGWPLSAGLFLLLLVPILVEIVLGIVLLAQTGFDPEATAPLALDERTQAVLTIITNTLTVAALLLLFKLFYRRPFSQMGLSVRGWLPGLAHGALFGIVSMALVFGLLLLTGQAEITDFDARVLLSAPFLLDLLKFVTVGFAEEILSRGYLMTVLKTTRRRAVIFCASALIFSLLHLMNPGVTLLSLINIFLVGILFAYMFIKTGRLWLPIGYHITWNFFQGNVFGFLVSGTEATSPTQIQVAQDNLINGGSFGPEGGLLVTLVILIGLAYVRFAVKSADSPEWTMAGDLPLVRGRKRIVTTSHV